MAFSYHPYARETVKAVEFARKKAAQIVSITDSRVSPIAGDGAISLTVNNTSKSLFPTVLPAMASRFQKEKVAIFMFNYR